MNQSYRAIGVGLALIFGSIALEVAGSSFQSLPLLIISFALAVAGALVSIRGVIEFITERI